MSQERRAREGLWPWLAVGLIVLAVGLLRWHLLGVSLERDEGEYAYGGQLLLQGVPPYALLYSMKLPGMYAAYALCLALFGQTPTGIHLGLLLVNAADVVMLFILGRQLASPRVGIVAAAVFALLSMGEPVQGVFANAEQFVLLPALAGTALLWAGLESRRGGLVLLSGLLLGLGFVVKQHGALFALWAGVFVLIDWRLRGDTLAQGGRMLAWLILGGLLPYLATCLLLWRAGVLANFWFWTVEYARAYASELPLSEAWLNLKIQGLEVVLASPLLWLAVAAGLPFGLVGPLSRRRRIFVLGFVLCSFLAVCPGFFFRPHYFLLFLPAAALLAGLAFDALGRAVAVRVSEPAGWGLCLMILLFCLGVTLYRQRQFLVLDTPAQASVESYWPNPFNESPAIADYIRAHSRPTDTIAILGSEPQICFYAHRRSATGYIYMYPLMENHPFALTMQQRLIAEVERARPEYLLFVRVPTSWLQGPRSHTLIYDWFVDYKKRYHRVGLVEIFEEGASRISWRPDPPALGDGAGPKPGRLDDQVPWPPETPYWVEVLRRNDYKSGEKSR
ncbi:MAG: glycosyltransferase family 39 protein [Desulfobacteraceae bacterium]|nr:glycosyltransferase family 39 protein [Desulfobacteraceae bacterium]